MKNIVTGIIISAGILLAPRITHAQGTVYVSSLSPTSTASLPVGSDYWLAAGFFVGNNAGEYVINSVQLAMTDATGDPSGFTVMIYSATIGTNPGSSLGT